MSRFPDPRSVDPETGVLCYGGNLDVETLIDAYSHGIFPWPHEGHPLLWFSPLKRAILEFKDLHLSRSYLKWKKSQKVVFRQNTCFEKVIRSCSEAKRPNQEPGTWITEEMIRAYIQFHEEGYAHSFEGWRDGELVCGLYGVYIKGVFSAESVFGRESNMGKLCLHSVSEGLNSIGISWLDVQALTPLTRQFGGKEVDQDSFFKYQKEASKNIVNLIWPSV